MKKTVSIILASLLCASALASCNSPTAPASSASDTARYETYLSERDCLPDSLIIGTDADAKQYGVDMTAFADDGFFTRADGGSVVMLAKTDAGIDRAVRDFAKFGNSDDYFKTYNEGPRVKLLTVCGNDIAGYAVVREDSTGDFSDSDKDFAATELLKYIAKACNVTLPSYTETEYASLAQKPAHVIRIAHDYPELGDEAFTVEITDSADVNVYGGRYRGCMYGVYDLLRDVGWRFLPDLRDSHSAADCIDFVYEAEHVDLTASLSRTERPAIAFRKDYDGGIFDYNRSNISDKRFLNGYGRNQYGLTQVACHGLQSYLFLEKAGIYGGMDAEGHQPCFTDPEVIQCAVDFALDFVQTRLDAGQQIGREIVTVDVAQYDMQQFCECKNCRASLKYDGARSGSVLAYTNAVAAALAENYPGVNASMLAYAGTNVPPAKTVPLDNVRISYCIYVDGSRIACSHHCVSGEDTPDCENYQFAAELNGWNKICKNRNLDVWYYPLNCYGGWAFQAPTYHTLYRDMRYLIDEIGINGILYHAANEGGANLNALTVYLGTELCWNADLTEDEYWAMIDEWFDIVFGDAGYYAHQYFLQNEEAGVGTGCWCTFHDANTNKINNKYYADHFDSWWDLFCEAKEQADTSHQAEMVSLYEMSMLYMCIGITHTDRYVNGDEASRAVIAERYEEMFRVYKKYDLMVFNDFNATEYAPDVLDVSTNPFDSWCTLWEN